MGSEQSSDHRRLRLALYLTVASALVWGIAHLWAGRTKTGVVLAALYVFVLGVVMTAITALRPQLLSLVLQPVWLDRITVAVVAIAALWIAVIVSSYRVTRPRGMWGARRHFASALVGLLCLVVATPMAYAARLAHVSQDVVNTVFSASEPGSVRSDKDAWAGKPRLNILLVGADAAKNRPGARTDSMTVASVDTHSGRTVLFSLPRNLEHVPMPPGPASLAFPYGFTGNHDATSPGLLNEVYEWGADHPDMVPGVADPRQRGITLLKQTIGGILGIDVDYYAMVDMRGFAQIIDAIGGVTVTVREPIVFGRYREGLLPAGTRRLSGEEALWYGRSRTDSDDYVRMGRQKCLLNAIAKQAEPVNVLRGFDRIADAAKRYVSTDVPQRLLPALVELSDKVKATSVKSVQFVPPLISTVYPDWELIKHKVSDAIKADRVAAARDEPGRPARATPSPSDAVSLDAICD
ncbi:LCP family protein [Streptosporangiaceae bacterium NEAU-GS5]|nr:LCP family protein [Streptosporangiaceae bacterium NEAU-GS5]